MFLAIDVGNTTIAAGLYDGADLLFSGKLAVDRVLDLDYWWKDLHKGRALADLAPANPDRVLVAIVNPKVQHPLSEWLQRRFQAPLRRVGVEVPWPMPVRVDNPAEVGSDRVVNAYAAYRRLGRALVVVDFGTAVTFDVVSEQGEYLGGVITPGLRMAARALASNTALLPYTDVRRPGHVIGTNTVDAIASGLYHGAVGMVDHLLERISSEMASKGLAKQPAYLATGGEAALVAQDSRYLRPECVVPELTLEGLRLIDEKAQGKE